jgi:hypothetical protein
MKVLLIVFALMVCSSCATRPIEPDASKIMEGVEHLKQDPLPELFFPKVPLDSLMECGDNLCLSGSDFKKLEFEIELIRHKLQLRHISIESRTRAYNELVALIGKEQVAYAYSTYRNDLLTEEVQDLRFTSTFQKWVERIGFGLVVCLVSGNCIP